jgi:hypothetical protein
MQCHQCIDFSQILCNVYSQINREITGQGNSDIIAFRFSAELIFYFFLYSFYSYMHTLFGPFLPLFSHPLPFSPTPVISRQNLFCPLLQFCWREDISNNKKDIAFLLVEIRIAIQRNSQHCFHAQVYYNPNWFISTRPLHYCRSPFHIELCCFKVTILAPLQWAHQTLSSFGFLTFPYSFCMCSSP